MEKKKIGIMGGTFNPIHNGHILLAQAAYDACSLDEVWFMPSGVSYLKEQSEIVAAEHRLNMTLLAVEDYAEFWCSDLEVKREGNTYTVDTLRTLCDTHVDCDFYFIMGADSFMALETWKEPEEIAKLCTLVTVVRDNVHMENLLSKKETYERIWNASIQLVPFQKVDISSSDVRRKIAQGFQVDAFLAPKVVDYIQKQNLYKNGDFYQDLLDKIKKNQTPQRFTHTLGVVEVAALLAETYGVEVQKAKVAALLHDCAKCISFEEQLVLCEKYQIMLTDIERENTELLHSKLGAVLAKEEYGIFEEDILESIKHHTTGRPAMHMLEKIIFVADYIEPNRYKAQNLTMLRKLAFENIDKAICIILEDTLSYLTGKGCNIDKSTELTLEYYKSCQK